MGLNGVKRNVMLHSFAFGYNTILQDTRPGEEITDEKSNITGVAQPQNAGKEISVCIIIYNVGDCRAVLGTFLKCR